MALLEIDSVTHKYDKHVALQNLSLTLKPGITGLLGANGAGKSTLMRILATITKPSAGDIRWNGDSILNQPEKVRAELGYLPQYFGVYDQLTAVEFLQYLGGLKALHTKQTNQKIHELLEQLNLSHVANQPLKGFSGGMKQRIGIAQALLSDPKLLIVDEPTVGLDPQERANFGQMLHELAENRVILLSTHIVSDIESLAHQIAVIKQGQLVSDGSAEHLQQSVAGKCWQVAIEPTKLSEYKNKFVITQTIRQNDKLLLNLVSDYRPDNSAIERQASLEDAYLYMAQNKVDNDVISEVA